MKVNSEKKFNFTNVEGRTAAQLELERRKARLDAKYSERLDKVVALINMCRKLRKAQIIKSA
jgi:hypothetical protein